MQVQLKNDIADWFSSVTKLWMSDVIAGSSCHAVWLHLNTEHIYSSLVTLPQVSALPPLWTVFSTKALSDMPTSGNTNLYFEAHKHVFFNKNLYFLKTYTNRLPLPHFITRIFITSIVIHFMPLWKPETNI